MKQRVSSWLTDYSYRWVNEEQNMAESRSAIKASTKKISVLTVATNLGLPVLGVHDSFIVAREEKDTLLQVVHVATKELIGQQLPVQITEPTRTERPTLGYLMRKRREEEESRR
jgi:hypothetical protein